MQTVITGQCHCGNISFELSTDLAVSRIRARACDCSFCRMHAARNWSDPNGRAAIHVRDPARLQRYRFGQRTADFYLCRTCGAYAGAVLADADGTWSTLNLRLTGLQAVAEEPVGYDREDPAERVARRKRKWTPTRVTGIV